MTAPSSDQENLVRARATTIGLDLSPTCLPGLSAIPPFWRTMPNWLNSTPCPIRVNQHTSIFHDPFFQRACHCGGYSLW